MNEAWTIFFAVAAAHLLGVASPGPDLAVVLRQTLRHGRRAGILTAAGIGSGILVHVCWGMFGLGWAAERFPQLMIVLRYTGAGVLLWLGLRSLQSKASSDPTPDQINSEIKQCSARHAYWIGFAINVLNVKAILFFVALSTSLIASGASIGLRLLLGMWLSTATMAWFSFIALSAGHPLLRRTLQRHAHRIDQVMGLILIAIAVTLIWPWSLAH